MERILCRRVRTHHETTSLDHSAAATNDDMMADADGTNVRPLANSHIAVARGGARTVRSPGPTGEGCVFELRLRR